MCLEDLDASPGSRELPRESEARVARRGRRGEVIEIAKFTYHVVLSYPQESTDRLLGQIHIRWQAEARIMAPE